MKRKSSRIARASQFALEQLEARVMLSASLAIRPTGNILRVSGTDHSDTITVGISAFSSDQIDVTINGKTQSFSADNVTYIGISGKKGNDTITVDELHGVLPVGVHVSGGDGNDTITGTRLSDTMEGGSGNDDIFGEAGNDYLYDNSGSNHIWAGDGNNTLIGGSGADAIWAGNGNNLIYGRGGVNTINTGTGTNTINAGNTATHVNDAFSAGYTPPTDLGVDTTDPNFVNNTPTGLTPTQIRQAYDFGSLSDGSFTNRGAGQAIAIVDAYDTPTAFTDLTRFSNDFGLTQPTGSTFRTVYANGVEPPQDPAFYDFKGWEYETSLDVQWAHAIAPDATIVLVEAASNLTNDLVQAVAVASNYLNKNFGGGVVSMSFGSPSETSAFEPVFSSKSNKNVSYVASSGDLYDQLQYPASSPYVLGVGGTLLQLDNNGNAEPGLTWNEEPLPGMAGSGGGVSTTFALPSYQTDIQIKGTDAATYSGGFRIAPDVAYNAANPVSVFTSFNDSPDDLGDSGWVNLEGTSAGAPQWAALVALANQQRRAAGRTFLGSNLNNDIYNLANQQRGSYFTDVIDEEVVDPMNQHMPWMTDIGYDEVTGWGTPVAQPLIGALTNVVPINTGTKNFDFNMEYLEATSQFPGGTATDLFGDYHGTGVATIGVSSITFVFTVTSVFQANTFGGFTITATRNSDGTFSGQEVVSVQGPVTTTSFDLHVTGSVSSSLHIDGKIVGFDGVTNTPITKGLEPTLTGAFSS